VKFLGVGRAVLGKIQGRFAHQPGIGVKLATHEALHVSSRREFDEPLNLPPNHAPLEYVEDDVFMLFLQ
jgi:hypothetical protein